MAFNSTKVSDGLGIGEGSISGVAITRDVGTAVMQQVDAAIASPDILVDVSTDDDGRMVDDDGCGDGRITRVVMRGTTPLHRSLNRAKVFGGGSAMAMADLIGSGRADGTLLDTFQDAIDMLAEHMINFGAHTADHVSNADSCGCGAIDGAPVAIDRVVTYRVQLEDQCVALGVSADGLDTVFDNFAKFNSKIASQPYRGIDVMGLIVDRGKIVKQLGGAHVEARIILNYVANKTVDQQRIHAVSDGNVDVFGVDVWRVQQLVEGLHPNDEPAQRRALQSMILYTLSVAAVLTKGDLPVYVIQSSETREPVAA